MIWVECERSRIFKQMQNGYLTKMAILKKVLEEEVLNLNKLIQIKVKIQRVILL